MSCRPTNGRARSVVLGTTEPTARTVRLPRTSQVLSRSALGDHLNRQLSARLFIPLCRASAALHASLRQRVPYGVTIFSSTGL